MHRCQSADVIRFIVLRVPLFPPHRWNGPTLNLLLHSGQRLRPACGERPGLAEVRRRPSGRRCLGGAFFIESAVFLGVFIESAGTLNLLLHSGQRLRPACEERPGLAEVSGQSRQRLLTKRCSESSSKFLHQQTTSGNSGIIEILIDNQITL